MPESSELIEKLKVADADIQQYVSALKAINARQHKRIFQLEAENVSLENRITAIKEGQPDPIEPFDKDALIQKATELLRDSGYTVTEKS